MVGSWVVTAALLTLEPSKSEPLQPVQPVSLRLPVSLSGFEFLKWPAGDYVRTE
jgi:hypothetical protein